MRTVTLGSTGIRTPQNAFGALPIQRISQAEAVRLLRMAMDAGMTFFDTARAYTDSEVKLGEAFAGVRERVYIASKTGAKTGEELKKDLETTLRNLNTDYLDLYQFHNPPFCPRPGEENGLYDAALEAKRQGKIRHIGITNHRIGVASEAIDSGLFETLQFPFCYLATERDIELVDRCREKNIGFIAMKGLSGGLLTNAAAAYAYIAQFDNVLPIWGVQRESELAEFLSFMKNPPVLTDELRRVIENDRRELLGNFCRSCGYCMPCPENIQIYNCARMSQLIRRSPSEPWLRPDKQAMMEQITHCRGCGLCKTRCPYGLDIPELLKKNLEDYRRIVSGEIKL